MKPGSPLDIALTAALAIAGVAAVAYGAWQIFPPAAWIFTGTALLFVSGVGQRPAAPAPEAPAK